MSEKYGVFLKFNKYLTDNCSELIKIKENDGVIEVYIGFEGNEKVSLEFIM